MTRAAGGLAPTGRVSVAVLAVAVIAAGVGALLPAPTPGSLALGAVAIDVLRGLGTSLLVAGLGTTFGVVVAVAVAVAVLVLSPRVQVVALRGVALLSAAPTPLFALVLLVSVRAARPALPSVLQVALDARWVLVLCLGLLEALVWTPVVHARLLAWRSAARATRAEHAAETTPVGLRRHRLSDVAASIGLVAVLALPSALAAEGFFSFLGFGVERPAVSLGALLGEGAVSMSVAPWTLWMPALALLAVTIALRVLGEALQERARAIRSAER